MLDFENRDHKKLEFNWPSSSRDINYFNIKFQNVPHSLDFEVKHFSVEVPEHVGYNKSK